MVAFHICCYLTFTSTVVWACAKIAAEMFNYACGIIVQVDMPGNRDQADGPARDSRHSFRTLGAAEPRVDIQAFGTEPQLCYLCSIAP